MGNGVVHLLRYTLNRRTRFKKRDHYVMLMECSTTRVSLSVIVGKNIIKMISDYQFLNVKEKCCFTNEFISNGDVGINLVATNLIQNFILTVLQYLFLSDV